VKTLLAATVAGALAMACTADGAGADKKGGERLLRQGVAVPRPGVAEPSGITYDAALGRLFVVGDEGTVAELDAQGGYLRETSVAGDLEDVAVHVPSGNLVLVDEKGSRLIVFDPRERKVVAYWPLDADGLVGKREGSRNGFEGLAFRPEAGRPGGGIFYLVHQRGPAMVVALAFDPAQPARPLGAQDVIHRWGVSGQTDLTAAVWVPSLQRVVVLSDSEDALLVLGEKGGEVEERIHVPGLNQEGACLDAAGDLWIADDRGGSVKRYAGALAVIGASLGGDGTKSGGKKKGKKD